MDLPSATADGRQDAPPLSRAVIIAVLAASLMVGAFAISNQSYWIDEALSLIIAKAPNPTEAWKYAQAVSGSTLQMPLYQLCLYSWHKMFGSGEWTMRASNLPWFLLGQLAFLLLLRHKPRFALFACLLAAVSPILWMYLDDTGPYLMQYAAACWLAAAIVRFSTGSGESSAPWLWLAVAAAVVVLFASSLLGVLWAGAYVLAMAVLLRGNKDRATFFKGLKTATVAAILPILAFGAYYAITWSDAGRGYHRSGASLLSLPFMAYEMLGFSGFGPGKLQMRIEPVRSVLRSLPALLPLAATLGLFAFFVIRTTTKRAWNRPAVTAWLLALGIPALVIFAGMFLFDHRPLPRHFLPALPALLLGLASGLCLAFAQKSLLWRSVAILVPLLWLGSALNFRWQPAHAKDDYRTAAAVAAAALRDNKEVWWAADPAAAYVYLTPIALEEVPGRAWAMQAPSWDSIRFKFPPRVIVISKPDIYDPQGAVARYAAENRFVPALQLQAFTIFAREGDELPAP